MRVIIIGAGAVGTMAAWRIARAGHEVVVLEQFALDHDRGSSYGDSRVIRRVYPDVVYTALMRDAYVLWHELQSHFPNQELFSPSGGLFFGPNGHPQILPAEQSLLSAGVAYERLDATECAHRFPAFKLNRDEIALYEPSMGYVRASRCVLAAAELARRHGAVIHESTPIVSIVSSPDRAGVQVITENGETLRADRLLLCAGPWIGQILTEHGVHLPLKVTRKTYVHVQPARHHENFDAGRFPVWIDAATFAYGFPRLGDVPGVKIAIHAGGQETSPDTVDREVHDEDRMALLEYSGKRFSDLSSEVVYEKVCLYTNTPDEDFIIDAVPQLPGAFLIGGLSGHGFKFAPLLGEIALSLVTDNMEGYNISRFSLSRFSGAAFV